MKQIERVRKAIEDRYPGFSKEEKDKLVRLTMKCPKPRIIKGAENGEETEAI